MTKVLDIALADGRFYRLLDALRAADMMPVIAGMSGYTLFAPTDDAFDVFQPLDNFLSDKVLLKALLERHFIPGRWMTAQLVMQAGVVTVGNSPLNVRLSDGILLVQDARITMRDIEGDDGVMHAIDKVLTPI